MFLINNYNIVRCLMCDTNCLLIYLTCKDTRTINCGHWFVLGWMTTSDVVGDRYIYIYIYSYTDDC